LLAQVPVELERKLLSMPSRVPVIVRNRIAFGADNMPIEAVRTVYKPNIYEFRMHLVRGQF
jgi:DNA-binding GntR family transcriptional regulator